MSLKKLKRLFEYLDLILYRGSDFDDSHTVGKYFSSSYEFSKNYGKVSKFRVKLENTFDIVKPEHFKIIKDKFGIISDPYAEDMEDSDEYYQQFLDIQSPEILSDSGNTWEVTEQFLDFIESLGFDSVRILEDGIVNYIIFNPQISKNIFRVSESLTKSPIEFSPSLNDIKKLLSEAKKDCLTNRHCEVAVRFIVAEDGNYYVANANDYIHNQMIKELNLSYANEMLAGELFGDGTLWVYRSMLLDYFGIKDSNKRVDTTDDEARDLFKSSNFYKIISSLVKNIDIKTSY